VGEHNQYLNLSKKKSSLQQGVNYKQFDVAKYVKDDLILSKKYGSMKLEQKYRVVHLTEDTLILVPKGEDLFSLATLNSQNQYVFVNSMLNYKFVEFYFETSFHNFDNPKEDRYKYIVYIDSAKNSRVVFQNESFNEGSMYTAPPSKVEYESLIKVLSSCDLSGFSEEDVEINKESPYGILEIRYNDYAKKIRGWYSLPAHFAENLEYFVCEYIELRANINMPWGWRIWIHQRKKQ
jgi:phage anti-repressor protein